MVDQEDIIALTKHVRSFSDALNNLRNSFKESCVDGVYNHEECQRQTHAQLGSVLKILQGVLAKYPLLHSPDILAAARVIITMMKTYNYADGVEGPFNFYEAIDQLALSFSSSVSDFLMGENTNEHEHEDHDEDYDPASHDEDEPSDDSLDRLLSYRQEEPNNGDTTDILSSTPESEIIASVSHRGDALLSDGIHTRRDSPASMARKHGIMHMGSSFSADSSNTESAQQRINELDKSLLAIDGSVDMALKRTKVWSKYSKDLLNYIERRSNFGLEVCRQIDKLAKQTKTAIVDENYLPIQSIFVTAMENDIEFNNNFHTTYHQKFVPIVEKLVAKQKEHDSKRSKIKMQWKTEVKKAQDSVEALKNAKKTYIQKEKDLEKFNKQMSEGKDEKGFTIGKKKGQEDFQKGATDSEEHYKKCVEVANDIQQQLERTRHEVLLQFRQLIFECESVMKSAGISYFQMMNEMISPLPIQCLALHDSAEQYVEGQQFSEYVQYQKMSQPQFSSPIYYFEPYKSDNKYSLYRQGGEQANITSPNSLKPRSQSNTSEPTDMGSKSPLVQSSKKLGKHGSTGSGTWGTLGRAKGSATDDTDSQSGHSLPGSPTGSPSLDRRTLAEEPLGDFKLPSVAIRDNKNRKMSAAAKSHTFRRLHAPSKCKECESYCYFNGQECEQCGIICHKKCLETLAIKCGNKRLPRKMTTFGVDFITHLQSTMRRDIPYIVEKCVNTIDETGLGIKGIYRVPGVKTKVEKLCQCFETGNDLVDLSSTPPHFIASVLKLYLRQLPEPLLTFRLYDQFIKVAKDSMPLKLNPVDMIDEMTPEQAAQYEDIIQEVHKIIQELPEPNFYTTAKIIRHLKRVHENVEENQMDASNLAIVFGPTLLRPEGNPNSLTAVMDISHQTRAVELLILNSQIFSHTKDGEIDIESVIGEHQVPYKPKKKHRVKIDTLHEVNDELREESEADVGSKFSDEIFKSFSINTSISMDDSIVPLADTPTSPTTSVQLSPSLKENECKADVFSTTLSSSISTTTRTSSAASKDKSDTSSISTTASSLDLHKQMEDILQNHGGAGIGLHSTESSSTTLPPFPVASPLQTKPTDCSDALPSYDSVIAGYSSALSEGVIGGAQGDYDNLPTVETTATLEESVVATTDLESVEDRFESIESLLSGDSQTVTQPPIAIPDHEDSDDAWMNKFGMQKNTEVTPGVMVSTSPVPTDISKEIIASETTKTTLTLTTEAKRQSPLSSPRSAESTPVAAADPFSYPIRKKKTASLSHIETTSYSFSLGNVESESSDSSVSGAAVDSDIHGSSWVKRDSKERVPVRKHLKSVNIKTAVTSAPATEIGTLGINDSSSTFALKDNPFTLNDSKLVNGPDSKHPVERERDAGDQDSVGRGEPAANDDTSVADHAENMEGGKRAPATLPKPKKHLDKKSWTADLIKSKSQTMADQPQPGSLNDKLLSINRKRTDEKPSTSGISSANNSGSDSATESQGKVRSIKEIRTNFTVSRNPNDVESGESTVATGKEEKIV